MLANPIEKDPNGKHQNEKGAKLDAGKLRAALVLGGFAGALESVVEVGTFGAEKYTPNGWKEVPDAEDRYYDAGYRHMLKDLKGERIDPDSGCLHIAQAIWNLLAVLEKRLEISDGSI